MIASELRIGNLVYDGNSYYPERPPKIVTVESIDRSGINIRVCYEVCLDVDIQEDNILPILLTPDILEKCGFKHEGLPLDDYWDYEGFQLWDGSDNDLIEKHNFYHVNDKMLIYCDYLHQLQNLIHALTGEELSITL